MIDLLSKRVQWLAPEEWLHKSVRTLLVVAPGLIFFVATGRAIFSKRLLEKIRRTEAAAG